MRSWWEYQRSQCVVRTAGHAGARLDLYNRTDGFVDLQQGLPKAWKACRDFNSQAGKVCKTRARSQIRISGDSER